MTSRQEPLSALRIMALAGGLVAIASEAQGQPAAAPVVAHLALGWAEPTHVLGESFEAGWLVSGGATFHPDARVPLGLRADLGHARFGVRQRTTESLATNTATIVDDGYTSVGNLSCDAIYEFGGTGRIGGYAGAGVGGYSRYQTVKQRVVTGPPPFCDPLLQICQTTTIVSTESDRLTTLGYDAGAALIFRLRSGRQFYIEARYHRMNSDPATEYLPLSVGGRW